jgi:hypothetical protein
MITNLRTNAKSEIKIYTIEQPILDTNAGKQQF